MTIDHYGTTEQHEVKQYLSFKRNEKGGLAIL